MQFFIPRCFVESYEGRTVRIKVGTLSTHVKTPWLRHLSTSTAPIAHNFTALVNHGKQLGANNGE